MSKRAIAFINEDNCIGCTICIESCPFDAIIGAQNFSHRVNYQECPGCKLCVAKCPTDCIEIKIIKEMITTSTSKPKRWFSILAKYNWLIFENKSTKAMFIKLLATRIVANNLLGFLSNFSISPFSLG